MSASPSAATAWLFASANEAAALDVARVVAAAGRARLAKEQDTTTALPSAAEAVAAWRKWYGEAVRSVERLVVEPPSASLCRQAARDRAALRCQGSLTTGSGIDLCPPANDQRGRSRRGPKHRRSPLQRAGASEPWTTVIPVRLPCPVSTISDPIRPAWRCRPFRPDRSTYIRAACHVERDADRLVQIAHDDLLIGAGGRVLAARRIHRRPGDCVAARRVASIGPVDHPRREIQIEVDRLGQFVEQHFDVGTGGRGLAIGHLQCSRGGCSRRRRCLRPSASSRPSLPPHRARCRRTTGSRRGARRLRGRSRRASRCSIRPGSSASRACLRGPTSRACGGWIELELFRREGSAGRNDRREVRAVQIDAFDHPVVSRRPAHERPVDVLPFEIDGNAVGRIPVRPRQSTFRSDPSGATDTTRPPRMSRKKRRVADPAVKAGVMRNHC